MASLSLYLFAVVCSAQVSCFYLRWLPDTPTRQTQHNNDNDDADAEAPPHDDVDATMTTLKPCDMSWWYVVQKNIHHIQANNASDSGYYCSNSSTYSNQVRWVCVWLRWWCRKREESGVFVYQLFALKWTLSRKTDTAVLRRCHTQPGTFHNVCTSVGQQVPRLRYHQVHKLSPVKRCLRWFRWTSLERINIKLHRTTRFRASDNYIVVGIWVK